MKKTQKNYSRHRIAVYRSNKHIYAQIIDDVKGITLASASDHELTVKPTLSGKQTAKKQTERARLSKIECAAQVGELLAQKAKVKKIGTVYFDRRNYKFHGRVKALAEGIRKGGLVF